MADGIGHSIADGIAGGLNELTSIVWGEQKEHNAADKVSIRAFIAQKEKEKGGWGVGGVAL